jgi:4-amino-4-deoxy-L-arabinose transferase-like glycosyltransferase
VVTESGSVPGATRSRLRLALFWLVIVVVSLLGLGRGLWTPDEPREAEIGREMYLTPSVVPHLDGDNFFEKPPLYYWALAAAYAVAGGPSPAAARAVSAAAALATLVALWLWAARAASRRRAFIAVALLATCTQFLSSTHWVLLDPLLMLWTTLAAWAGWEALTASGKRRTGALVAFYAALALALWTKGLVGPLLTVAGLALYCGLARAERPWRRLALVPGVAAGVVALAGLALALWLDHGREALYQWLWVNHVERLVSAPGSLGHRQPIYYYLQTLPVAVLPWLLPFAGLLRPSLWRRGVATSDRSTRLLRYCGALVGGGLVLLTLSSSKRETYLLPVLPPLLLAMAAVVEERWEAARRGAASHGGWRALEWAQVAVLALFALAPAAGIAVWTRSWTPSVLGFLAAAVTVTSLLVLATARHDARRCAASAALAVAVALGGVFFVAVPALERVKDFGPFLHSLDGSLPPGEPVYALGADETLRGIVPFETGRRLIALEVADLAARSAAAQPEHVLVQSGRRTPPGFDLPADYTIEAQTSLGRDRILALWQRRAAATQPTGQTPPR